jgi:glycine betaine/choline ABC-type transport system substrate-binding protein
VVLILEGQISNEEMIAMNFQVDAEGAEPKDVAKAFLVEKGLLK